MTGRRVLGLVGTLAFASAFAALALVDATRGGGPFWLDARVHDVLVSQRTSQLTTAAVVVTSTGSGPVAYALAAASGAVARGRARWWTGAVLAVVCLALVEALRLGISTALARPRPPRADWAYHAGGYAFPSGHTTTSSVVAALTLVALVRRGPRTWVRWTAGCSVVGWALCVGLSRVYLGVHWPTDVLGGWLLVLTLSAGLALARTSRGAPSGCGTAAGERSRLRTD